MKIVIALLKSAVSEYEKGVVADADQLLRAAMRLRTETLRAEKLNRSHFTVPKDKTT